MLRLTLWRYFSTIGRNQASQLKEKLYNFEKYNTIMRKSPKALNRLKEKRKTKLQELNRHPYSRSRALDVIKRRYKEDGEKIEIGPTTNADLKYLKHTKDKRLIYSTLGITQNQLRDSRLVSDDVAKLLKRGQVEKALYMIRLAKTNGTAGLNRILEYYLYHLKSPQSAVSLYNWSKKIGVSVNEYTNSILFNGISKQEHLVSAKIGNFVYNTTMRMKESNKLSQIEFNSALSALSNCTDISFAFKLFNDISKMEGIKADSITFIWMLRSCINVKTDALFDELFNDVTSVIPKWCIDSQLLFEICRTIHLRKEDYRSQMIVLNALKQYFQISEKVKVHRIKDGHLLLPALSKWGMEQLPLNSHIIGLFFDVCQKLKKYKLMIDLYETLGGSVDLVDIGIFHQYLEALIKEHPTSCSYECIRALESKEEFLKSAHTLVLCYEAFKKQSLKSRINSSTIETEKLLIELHNFIIRTEGQQSTQFDFKIYPMKSWKYVFRILKNLDVDNNVPKERKKYILIEFVKCLHEGSLSTDRNTDTQRFVELEAVRLINNFAEELKLVSWNKEVVQCRENLEGKQFLQRRLLLRLKDRLLRHIGYLETQNYNETEVKNLEWSIGQLASKTLKLLIEK
ncbi:hypothetical protein KAFR_0L01080 [Kazachstania africana CBS 2517]|uniref:Mitochondrial group I intron splicing factor CCM1 n=1 Tax=Kazachstania africana (strain ATCC 22294 / BCRC 22015 / CBS 2517 / CECT 1963 / NBRC 1671 / NRRL Y-8276) TaxID=1071382 RepID=H2B266_KAZAF|nr:hypothetical protein KAFR_0L01080 [Kazachstania africana CBS 2517]CCF60716.1 hypothetical protein KAFR_0L01080 [Kazachstania africana CBS 2517]